jgi:translocation and assembly module TamB
MDLNTFRAVENDTYRATANGDLTLTGRTTEPRLEGSLRLRNTDIFLDEFAGGDVEQVSLEIDDERMLEEVFGYRIDEADTLSLDFYRAMAMDLAVELDRDTWIRQRANPEMAIEMTGRIEIQKESGSEDMLLYRTIEVVPQRSFIEQFGRRFNISSGSVSFNGPLSEMVMDVSARYEVLSRLNPGEPEATITLGLSGRLDDLDFELGSEPAMDNTDIVSYIATGRPASQSLQFAGAGQGGVLGVAAGQLAGVIEGVAAANLGLDVIEIQQDGLKGTQLTAGKYISGRTYLGISQPINFGGEGSARARDAREVTLEYKVWEWLLLQIVGETNTSTVKLNLTGRYSF